MVVTISGLPGSGTTTLSRLVASDLGLVHINAGEVFRSMAAEAGMTVTEFGRYVESHPEVDTELDRRMGELAARGSCLLEARLAGWVTRNEGVDALRVWVECDDRARAVRLAGREGKTIEEAVADNAEREASERSRYLAFYGIDLADLGIYDLVLDSGSTSPDDLAEQVHEAAANGPSDR